MNPRNLVAGIFLTFMMQSAFAVPVVLEIEFDDFPDETYFGMFTAATAPADPDDLFFDPSLALDGIAFDSTDYPFGTLIPGYAQPFDFFFAAGDLFSFTWDLVDGDYTFIIADFFGDGLCCFNPGQYSLTVDGAVVGAGGQFGSSEATNFTVREVPEPGTLALLALGLAGLGASRKARKNSLR